MSQITNINEYHEHYDLAKKDHRAYWSEVAKDFHWFKDWDSVQTGNFEDLNVKWFEGGKTNMSYNCLDRHLQEKGQQTALIFEDNNPDTPAKHFTYKELHQEVCRFANVLKDQGIKKGDRVCFYMSMVPELLIGVLACTRIGAIHSVVFGGFSANALAGRIQDSQCKILITNDGGYRGDKIIPLKDMADQALETCPSVKSVLVLKKTNIEIKNINGRDFDLRTLLNKASNFCQCEEMDSEDPLFILYTSGSTGKPKGLLHTTAGYMVFVAHTFKNVFQVEENDIYWCTADIGWITGHSYITYGPLLNGSTTVMFEGVPTWPDAGRFWDICDKLKVTHFYTAPTAIRALQAFDIDYVNKHSLSTLKVLGSVGEPINEEAWEWFHKNIGKEKCPIVDTWWQTETGGILISPLAGITKLKPAHATFPLPGVLPVLLDAEGKEVLGNPAEGNLCIQSPWPSLARTIWGDHKRYQETYFSTFPGKYFTGDGAKRDQNGLYRITGRVDDVINIAGHRMGTAEIEEAINQHPEVIESAVVGFPHSIKGQGIYAYVIPSNKNLTKEVLHKELNDIITKLIGPIAKLDALQITEGLPKTRSGKIMRRILRKIASSDTENLGDISTLLNPEIVDKLMHLNRPLIGTRKPGAN